MRVELTTNGEVAILDQRNAEVGLFLDCASVEIRIIAEDVQDAEIYQDAKFGWTPIQEEEIVEALKESTFDFDGSQWDAGTFFESGGCSQLAKALGQRNHGCDVVAIYDAVDEDGEMLTEPHLIHAAMGLGDDHVLDINGVAPFQDWIDQWGALGMECSVMRFSPGETPFTYASNAYRSIAQEYAFALSIACARSIRDLGATPASPAP
jgi:hypothetical protein